MGDRCGAKRSARDDQVLIGLIAAEHPSAVRRARSEIPHRVTGCFLAIVIDRRADPAGKALTRGGAALATVLRRIVGRLWSLRGGARGSLRRRRFCRGSRWSNWFSQNGLHQKYGEDMHWERLQLEFREQ